MMRVCHLDTCPVGVATQDPVLRSRFSGKPEFVVNFFEYIAEEVREILAELGFRTLEEAVGHSDALDFNSAISHWKAEGLDLSPILYRPESFTGNLHHTQAQDHGLAHALDNELIKIAQPALTKGEPVRAQLNVRNVNRTVGTMLGSELTRIYGGAGLPESTIDVTFEGSAGQSFGAFLPTGITLRLEGDSNDYVGKGLSGGRLIVRPARTATFAAENNVIAGNVLGYGATSGKIFARGLVGERCCVRNSGATIVVEGVGDHGCEYMTGGRVLILGPTGRNFAAGMSGGIAYVLDLVNSRVNSEMVDIEPLSHDDEIFVKALIAEHAEETGSAIAQTLLTDWEAAMPRLSKVMPRDYKRVIEAQAKAEAEGRDVLEAIMEAARG
jgi:glutamate synthase (NADPH/NADH) large chain